MSSKPSDSNLTSNSLKLCENLRLMCFNTKTCDIFFVFEEGGENLKKIPAHRCLLAADSSVFYRTFYIEPIERIFIEITDVTAIVFEQFIRSFYEPEISINGNNVGDLIQLAKKYDAKNCKALCGQYLKSHLQPENVCMVFESAIYFDDMELYESCMKTIERNYCKVLTSDSFMDSSHDVIKHLLSAKIRNRDEFSMFEACMQWAKKSFERKNKINSSLACDWRRELGDCFDLIQFTSMTPLQFMKCEINYPIFNSDEQNNIKSIIISNSDEDF